MDNLILINSYLLLHQYSPPSIAKPIQSNSLSQVLDEKTLSFLREHQLDEPLVVTQLIYDCAYL